jgi:hypothetical protein
MTEPFDSITFARSTALVAVASLLLAAGCSAPPGTDTGDDGVPPFSGALPSGGAGASGGVTTPSTGAPPAAAPSPTGTGGAASEQTGGSGIGLQPSPPPPAQSGAQNAGAGGSTMVSGAAGSSSAPGAAGSSFEPDPGAAGAPPAAPNDGQQPPPQAPPPNDGQQPPNDGQPPPPNDGQQPPPQEPPPPAAPAPSGDCTGAFFCDGFDSVAAGASPTSAVWRVIDGFNVTDASAKVTVSTADARSGAQSLRITEDGGRTGVLATLPQSSYFVRAFFKLDAAPLGTVFIGGGTSENNETRFRIQGQSYATINSVGSVGDPVRPANANSGNGCPDCFTLPVNEWFCAELGIDNATSTATLFINDVEVAVAGADAFASQPAQPLLFLGSWGLQGGATGAFIDDVAVGPERFGCN